MQRLASPSLQETLSRPPSLFSITSPPLLHPLLLSVHTEGGVRLACTSGIAGRGKAALLALALVVVGCQHLRQRPQDTPELEHTCRASQGEQLEGLIGRPRLGDLGRV